MDLDMYLSKKYYVKNWEYTQPEDRYSITIKKGGENFQEIATTKIQYI